jgi:hypothetical protein
MNINYFLGFGNRGATQDEYIEEMNRLVAQKEATSLQFALILFHFKSAYGSSTLERFFSTHAFSYKRNYANRLLHAGRIFFTLSSVELESLDWSEADLQVWRGAELPKTERMLRNFDTTLDKEGIVDAWLLAAREETTTVTANSIKSACATVLREKGQLRKRVSGDNSEAIPNKRTYSSKLYICCTKISDHISERDSLDERAEQDSSEDLQGKYFIDQNSSIQMWKWNHLKHIFNHQIHQNGSSIWIRNLTVQMRV